MIWLVEDEIASESHKRKPKFYLILSLIVNIVNDSDIRLTMFANFYRKFNFEVETLYYLPKTLVSIIASLTSFIILLCQWALYECLFLIVDGFLLFIFHPYLIPHSHSIFLFSFVFIRRYYYFASSATTMFEKLYNLA